MPERRWDRSESPPKAILLYPGSESVPDPLAEGRGANELLQEYGAPITEALDKVGSVEDPEQRALLWNLCALRVHLLLLAAHDEQDERTRGAVLDCSRRFMDRPELGKAWMQEVARAFSHFTSEVRRVQLSVKSAPAACTLRIYGAEVGVTPQVVDVIPGPQEVQLECAGRRGAIHRVEVHAARDLVIRFDGDTALSSKAGTSWLRYASSAAAQHALDDAGALALEAQADSFVIIRADRGSDVAVQWMRVPATLLGSTTITASGGPVERADEVARVFHLLSHDSEQGDSLAGSHPGRQPVSTDYALSAGLVATGAGLSIFPIMAMVRDGQCTNADCASVYDGKSWSGSMMLAGAGALVAAGVAVLWLAPFGKPYSVSIGSGLAVKGTF